MNTAFVKAVLSFHIQEITRAETPVRFIAGCRPHFQSCYTKDVDQLINSTIVNFNYMKPDFEISRNKYDVSVFHLHKRK